MKNAPKKRPVLNRYDVIWLLLALFMFFRAAAGILVIFAVGSNLNLWIETLISVVLFVLLLKHKFAGVVILTFGLLMAMLTADDRSRMIIPVIALIMTLPLWIHQFSKK